ncbi:SDR family oxidoreductase [Bacillus sp. CGMCC 1.16541]|uniref:SDR family NAD(P)-dependent oxidoreductase n=1 Tax=Bacillus sp. CGMCC 1.16541 TaxID=2185143 RepID=UPI000D733432|nr:SDR family oxidoreductase [Bacillus sp. CGMCC 1.16541]
MRLEGKTALVTGGSRGLGKTMSLALAKEGATVIVNYVHSEEAAKQVVEEIEAQRGKAFAIQADVTDEDSVKFLIQEIYHLSGNNVDVLVNNATGPQPELSIEQSTWQDYEDQLLYFVKAPLLLLKEVLPAMKEKGRGSIINIGSEVVQTGNAHFSNYVTAKSAMLGMTRSWASELGSFGIRVNLVNPGFTPVERHQHVAADAIEEYRKQVPLQRMGTPEDIANAVVYLASEESSFVTGQSLSINGGHTFSI